MTPAQTVAELRKSAREDAHPFRDCGNEAYYAAASLRSLKDARSDDDGITQHRVFFLLVACALEGE